MAKHPLDDFEVVWNGGPLLPERETVSDPNWDTITRYYSELDPTKQQDAKKKKTRAKSGRLYNKSNTAFWNRTSRLRHRPATAEGQATLERAELAGESAGRVPDDSDTEERGN